MLRSTHCFPKHFPALILHLLAKGQNTVQCWSEPRQIQFAHFHIHIFAIAPACVFEWCGQHRFYATQRTRDTESPCLAFMKWQ